MLFNTSSSNVKLKNSKTTIEDSSLIDLVTNFKDEIVDELKGGYNTVRDTLNF